MKKVEVLFSDQAIQSLEKLQKTSSSGTRSNLIRNALKVYNTLQDLKEDDNTITIEKDGKTYKMILP